MNDDAIIGLFLARNEQAIAEAKTKYESVCRRTAQYILGDAEDSEECASDVLLILWNNIPPENPRSLKAYIIGITKRSALKKLRDSRSEVRSGLPFTVSVDELSECIPSREDTEGNFEAKELTELLNRWLGALKTDDRMLFLRRYWFDDSVKELAEKLGESPKATAQRLYVLRKKLRKFLEREGFSI